MKKICLLGYYGAANLGDELLLKVLVEKLLINQNLNLCVFSENIQTTQKNIVLSNRIELVNKFDLLQVFISILQSEALLFGGGSVFQDVSSLKSIIYYFSVALLAKLLNKKLLLVGQGIGPLKTKLAEFLTRLVYQSADFVSVRDLDSWEKCQSWQVKAFQAADLVWFLNDNKRSTKQNNSQVLISLRPYKELSEERLKTFAEFLKLTHLNCKFNLVAFQLADLEVLRSLKNYLGETATVHEIYSPISWKELGQTLFNEASFAYCMRFHALILALKAALPMLVLSYDPKLDSLCTKMQLPFLVIEEISLQNLNKTYMQPQPSLEELENKMQEETKLAQEQLDKVLEVLGG